MTVVANTAPGGDGLGGESKSTTAPRLLRGALTVTELVVADAVGLRSTAWGQAN